MGLGLSAKYFSSIVLLILENIFVDLHLGKIMNAGHLQGMDYFFFPLWFLGMNFWKSFHHQYQGSYVCWRQVTGVSEALFQSRLSVSQTMFPLTLPNYIMNDEGRVAHLVSVG